LLAQKLSIAQSTQAFAYYHFSLRYLTDQNLETIGVSLARWRTRLAAIAQFVGGAETDIDRSKTSITPGAHRAAA
jgi:hypothetical protein